MSDASDAIEIMVMSGPFDGTCMAASVPADPTVGYVFGRRDDCDFVFFYDRWVSGRHARLFRKDRQWFIEDLGSTNNTFLGKRNAEGAFAGRELLKDAQPIGYGQLIQLGRLWIRLQPAAQP